MAVLEGAVEMHIMYKSPRSHPLLKVSPIATASCSKRGVGSAHIDTVIRYFISQPFGFGTFCNMGILVRENPDYTGLLVVFLSLYVSPDLVSSYLAQCPELVTHLQNYLTEITASHARMGVVAGVPLPPSSMISYLTKILSGKSIAAASFASQGFSLHKAVYLTIKACESLIVITTPAAIYALVHCCLLQVLGFKEEGHFFFFFFLWRP